MELWHFVNPGFIKYVFSFHWIFLEYILLMMLRYVLVVWLISCVLWTWEDCWVGIGQEMSQRRGCDTVSVAGCWLRWVVPAHLNNPCHLISPPHSLFKVPFIIEDVPQRQGLGLITSEIRNDNVLVSWKTIWGEEIEMFRVRGEQLAGEGREYNIQYP